jgi:hypothetical protein
VDSFYIYYRVEPAQREAALAAIRFVFAEVQARCGVVGRLLQRADESAIWMEVFEGIDDPQGFQAILDESVARSGLTELLADKGVRHIEHFRENLPAC